MDRAPEPRSITVLGATGSVGRSTCDLLASERDRYQVEAVVGGQDAASLARCAIALRARVAVIGDASQYSVLKERLVGTDIETAAGEEAVIEAASRRVDWTMAAISGTAGLRPTLAAVRRGGKIALANKECLVCAGRPFLAEARQAGAEILPVDSEHNAIAQALCSGKAAEVARITLTASGGPFRQWDIGRMRAASPADALRHPTWSMGRKISIDSATMMNKALEVIEAHHLFSVARAQLAVLVHPQSIVHGLVHWRDGSVIAGMAPADMRVPIAHCLGYPQRIDTAIAPLDLATIGTLSFEPIDETRFRAVALAMAALDDGPDAATALNAANEIAVEAFLGGRIRFTEIAELVEAVLDLGTHRFSGSSADTIDHALAVDHEVRADTRRLLPRFGVRAD